MKNQGIIFSVRKASQKNIDLSYVCRNSSFDQWLSLFFVIHLAHLRSVKIVQKSVKSQGIFQFLMSGNPVRTPIFFLLADR